MKTNYYSNDIEALPPRTSSLVSAIMLLLMIAVISCSEDDPDQAPLDVGSLSASTTAVVIDYDKPTEEAVVFSWHAEKTPTIQYDLIFTAGGNTDTVEVLSEVNKKFIHAELNRILVDQLQLPIGAAANVDVHLRAKVVDGNKATLTDPITITVTPSEKVPEPPLENVTLSVSKSTVNIDLANPAGETVTFAWEEETNLFIHYKLVLTSGTKSATVDLLTDISKEFTNAELNTLLVDQLQLEIGKPAEVNVKVNAKVTISDKAVSSAPVTITVTPVNKTMTNPAYTKLWIVGNATPNGWNIGNPNAMVNDPTNIYQFKFNEVLNAGEFKIPVTTGNWGADYYMPPANHPALSSTSVKFTPGGNPDNKWNIESGGAYKVLLNISSNPFITITPFTPYENIYIIGDATEAGWDADNAIAMTPDAGDANVFIWTGELKSTGRGQFRFLLEPGDLNGASFVAPSSNASIAATQLALTMHGAPANNFKVKAGEEGVYKITINQLKETISIVKQ
jgi:starch-binding outer membrane protein SusE/F